MSKRTRRQNVRTMSQHESAAASKGAIEPAGEGGGAVEAFTFGDPEPVLSRATMLDMLECWHNSRWYEPPIPLDGLARAYRASPHHSSAIILKRNMLAASLDPASRLSRKAFAGLVQDYLVMGNAYVQQVRNRLGGVLRIDHCLAKYVRRGVEPGRFWWVPSFQNETEFEPGSVHQLMAPDVNQEIYGLPEYLSALQSALLNENATLFRRRYYENGSHAGYILHATGQFADGDVEAIRQALKKSKGPGNFRNLFIHAPDGKENSIKLLPIAEAGAKDEFLGIKNTTRDDVLAAHRVPPQLLGIVPANAGGFGDVTKATDAFFELEIEPLQSVFLELNDMLGVEAVRFRERVKAAA
ncbi:phage portal protein [Sphingomonas sp. IC081]|uniref:phage portal protein n=1 Tax=Sphingomonas sp. IC081 TaxID=304378 RepID=UPI00115894BB|nr:phage portal protein [Sphingomonas sp. IC081]QDK32579.1 phage portal protein [Sphingomonas sp. IC081]